ncbi:replication initiation protein [Sporosarcina sp. FSL K6-1508]|uniref:replication initiation protein n=1 Tax=Sporosarcina sp. FSL K6-1508 TaxID=2921553 RepID=UPI0030F68811
MSETPLPLIDVRFSPENIITKSNMLIDSSYRLTALESKLILTLFSNVQPSDQDLNTYVFPIMTFVDLLELKSNSMYKDLRKITKGLLEKSFEIKMGDEIHQVSWLSYVKYNEKKGSITLRFDSFWKPYILHIQKNFTTYKLGNITKLKSSYSIRLYELLKQRQGLRTRTFNLDELRDKLGIPEDTYPKYANFKQRILLTAQRELLQESDISFDFIEIKHGRAVEKIKFQINNNSNTVALPIQVNPTYPEEKSFLLRELLVTGIAQEDAEKLISLFTEERIIENLNYTNERIKLGHVKKPAAYLKRAIEQNFASTKSTKQEIVPEWMDKKNNSITIGAPDEQESLLLNALDLMKSIGNSEEKIDNDISIMMRKFQNHQIETVGRPYLKFNDPYLQQIGLSVIDNLQIKDK